MRAERDFPGLVEKEMADPVLRESLGAMEASRAHMYKLAFDELDDAGDLKARATAVRRRSIAGMAEYLQQFERNVLANGGRVHWAADGSEANEIIGRICRDAQARLVTKSKSMVTEEIELVPALELAGFEVVETDLGEYIIQLRGETPSHITAPSLHVSLQQVIDTFNEHHQVPRDRPLETADQLLAEARAVLREKFLHADVGITGANFLVAETGSVIVVTNEGNADLTTTLTRTHIVVTGIEKVVATLEDAEVLLRILPRAAVGQRLTNYTSFFHGPRGVADADGPNEFHVVLLDNGRSAMLGTEFEDMLRCIRCAACLNHCPVYTAIGGHAYGSVYPGPMGAVLTPQLAGLAASRHLPNASTFCGRCAEVCPVGIPLPKLMRHWREREFANHLRPAGERRGLRLWAWLNDGGVRYRLAQAVTRKFLRWYAGRALATGWLRHLPGPGRAWAQTRDFPVPPEQSFQQLWSKRERDT
ncbi:MAG: LutB/LldF family L-lactate oxidation iron-sulfur protein [Gammaproteobacteria bacterium]